MLELIKHFDKSYKPKILKGDESEEHIKELI